MKFIPYLTFQGNAEEALNFYAKAFNGTIETLMRYSEMPSEDDQPPLPEGYSDKILHASLNIGGQSLFLSDAFPGMTVTAGNKVEINIAPSSEEELRLVFENLSVGGNISMPVEETFWGSLFGSLTDQFGIGWSLDLALQDK